jgi:hypothetical protein
MAQKPSSPLQAGFWLTKQEKRYILVICALFLLGLAARYLFLKNQKPNVYTPAGIEQTEPNHE